MFNIKKKLNAILPGEGARGALQNVLTVDWSGNKTVLVEIPNAGASRSNEVEMNGMGDGGYGQYGRLNDDEQDEREYLTQPSSRFNISRGSSYNSQTEQQGQYAPPLPPKNPSYSKEQSLHPNNPFRSTQPHDEIDQLDDFAPRYQQPQNPYATQPKASAPNSRAVDEPRGWHTFSNSTFDDEDHLYGKSRNPGAQRPVEDPWSGKNWGIGNGVGQASPTTSTSTRNSGGTVNSDEDPFR